MEEHFIDTDLTEHILFLKLALTRSRSLQIIPQRMVVAVCRKSNTISRYLIVQFSDFSFTHNGCVSDSVAFLDNTNGQGRTVTRWYWDFGDGNTGVSANPKHKYITAGAKTVRHAAITDVGCLSDTASKIIPLSDPPIAKFGISAPYCEKSVITFSDSSTIATGAIVRWSWNLGDGNSYKCS
jgi:PKD repeat protein